MKIELSFGGLLLLFLITFLQNFLPARAAPSSLVTSTARPKVSSGGRVAATEAAKVQRTDPYIESFRIHSDIQFRYSRTKVQSVIVNPSANKSHEVTFHVTLPDTAFISNFSMTIGDKTWIAEVEKQEEATKAYKDAVAAGKSAGLVETRSANVFTVFSNVEASESITFTLTYDELLQRRIGTYEQAIHIDSAELRGADAYEVAVTVADAQNITMLRAIGGREDGGIEQEIPGASVTLDGNLGIMTWSPDTKSTTGGNIPRRIVLQYDVADHSGAGQVIIRDGHFVHFFSPQAPVRPQHVVFVLDTSSSMNGTKLGQLKEAMTSILKDMGGNHRNDHFSIITFNGNVKIWNGLSGKRGSQSTWTVPVTQRSIRSASLFINGLRADGAGANIHDALISALNLTATVAYEQQKGADPIIMLLTASNPTEGVTDVEQIQSEVKTANQVQQVPIFSLGFGSNVNFPFLRKLSLQNGAVARKIYETSDAAQQLQNFYGEISSLALSNLNITYTSDLYRVKGLTRRTFSRFFKGGEIIVAGKLETDVEELNDPCQSYCVKGNFVLPANVTSASLSAGLNIFGVAFTGSTGTEALEKAEVVLCENRTTSASEAFGYENLFDQDERVSFMERLWAYLTIKQLLEQAEANDATVNGGASGEEAQRALDLALHYEFVTPLTSLVVEREHSSEVPSFPSSKGYENLIKGLKSKKVVSKSVSDSPWTTKVWAPCKTRSRPPRRNHSVAKIPKRQGGLGASATSAQSPSKLTINDIKWLSADKDRIELGNGIETFHVARGGQADHVAAGGGLCPLGGGTCIHLQDCVRHEFIDQMDVYLEDHFCEISGPSGHHYAGVCCPATHKSTRATATTVPPFTSPITQSSEFIDYTA